MKTNWCLNVNSTYIYIYLQPPEPSFFGVKKKPRFFNKNQVIQNHIFANVDKYE